MPEPYFEINKRRHPLTRQWRFWVVLVATNGEPLSTSEMLKSEHAALVNVEAQRFCAPGAEVRRAW